MEEAVEITVFTALHNAGVAYEDFSPEQMDVIYSVAESGGELEDLLNPEFPPEQMQLIADVQNRTDAISRAAAEEALEPLTQQPMTLAEVNHARRQHNLPLDSEAETEQPVQPKQESMNFRITDDDLGAGGPKTKYKANVEAIRVLQTLDAEQRQATAEEQEILSRYVGWGGIPQAFDESNAEWSKEYAELQSLLTADEYKEARASTLNGYIRNPMTKRNEIDPEAAFYVQLIFQWELMGVPIFEIARRMTLLQVPTPREWHRKMVEGKEVLTCKKWGVTTIRHILENQTYVGDTINNKSTQKLFAGQDKHDLPKEQWYVAKNTHPAIIARDDFEKVQKILNKNRAVFKTVRAKSEQIRAEYQNDLAGMVFCADCGRPMEFERLPHGAEESKKVCYYICKARQADDKCIGHQIPEKLLKALIMDQLHLFIVQLSDKRKVLEELQKIEDVQNPVYRAKGEIMSLTDKVCQMAKKREQLYADYVAGVVDSEDYQLIREDYSRQYDGLRAALQEAESKKTEVERQIEEYLNMTSHLEEHLDNFEFDIQLVKSLVQKIEVSADKRIRIVFGFQDVFTELGKESAET